MRILFAAALAVPVLGGCAVGGSGRSSAAESRVERCTERILAAVDSEDSQLTRQQLRRYVERTYCARFEERGLIYEDGTLSIDVYTDSGSEHCEIVEPGQPSRPVPCEQFAGRDEVLDCALLQHVRKSEVRRYLAELRERRGTVTCDDDTPLDQLGAE